MIMNSIDFPLCALFIIILLNVLFFGKKRINILETQIYKKIIIYSYNLAVNKEKIIKKKLQFKMQNDKIN